MSRETFGVLVHGAGWVSAQHIAAFGHNTPPRKCVAISSRKLASAQRSAEEAGLAGIGLTRFGQSFRHPGVDIASVCTPQHVHCGERPGGGARGQAPGHRKTGRHFARPNFAGCATRCGGPASGPSSASCCDGTPFSANSSPEGPGALGRLYSVEADYLSHNGVWWSGWTDTCKVARGQRHVCGRVPRDRRAALVRGARASSSRQIRSRSSPWPAAIARAGPSSSTRSRNASQLRRARRWSTTDWKWRWSSLTTASSARCRGQLRLHHAVSVSPPHLRRPRHRVQQSHLVAPIPRAEAVGRTAGRSSPNSGNIHTPSVPSRGRSFRPMPSTGGRRVALQPSRRGIRTHEVAFAALECYRTRRPVRLPLLQKSPSR